MAKRQFQLQFSMYGEPVDKALIELDDAVIEAVDDEWRSVFYALYTAEGIAAHIGFNLIIRGVRLSMLDGWADLPNEYARVLEWPNLDMWEVEAEEV